MKKNLPRTLAALGLLLIVWNVLAFVIPFDRTTLFWMSYGLATFALIAQAPILILSFRHGGNLRSQLYGVPIARIGGIYLIVQIVMSLLFMALSGLFPFWVAFILEVLLIAAEGMPNLPEPFRSRLPCSVPSRRKISSCWQNSPAIPKSLLSA